MSEHDIGWQLVDRWTKNVGAEKLGSNIARVIRGRESVLGQHQANTDSHLRTIAWLNQQSAIRFRVSSKHTRKPTLSVIQVQPADLPQEVPLHAIPQQLIHVHAASRDVPLADAGVDPPGQQLAQLGPQGADLVL